MLNWQYAAGDMSSSSNTYTSQLRRCAVFAVSFTVQTTFCGHDLDVVFIRNTLNMHDGRSTAGRLQRSFNAQHRCRSVSLTSTSRRRRASVVCQLGR